MKLHGHVTAVEDIGDGLRVTAQAQSTTEGDWAPWHRVVIEVPPQDKARRAFYVGRHITVVLKAK